VLSPWKAGDSRARVLLYFGDLIGNVYALDAVTGRLVWKRHPEAHPGATITATPALYGGRLYIGVSSLEEAMNDPHYACCTFRGLLIAYDARTGRQIWRTYTVPPPTPQGVDPNGTERLGPSGAGVWGSPAIDPKRRQVYIVTGDNYSDPPTKTSDAVLALDLASGKVKWVYQATAGDAWNNGCRTPGRALCPLNHGMDTDFGAAPILAAAGRGQEMILAGQKSGWVYALDPDTGRGIWKRRVGRGGIDGGVEFGMALLGHRLFVPINDMMDATLGLHVPGVAKPGMHALDIRGGAPLWQTPNDGRLCHGRPSCNGGLQSAPTATPGLIMIGSLDGWLRIYSAATGEVLWRYDTTQPVRTVSGGTTRGGSMGGGAGPIAYHRLLIVPSGYGFARKMPGDALLVFQTDQTGPRHPFQ
jgi:polyvinyl alcohol dehydrogenase (cytochrome)